MSDADGSDDAEAFMEIALDQARRAFGETSPNPMVGCVIVDDGEVVATGHHAEAGAPHAEIVALDALGGRAAGCEMYVTLEPCCHSGRTEPCTEALIDAGVERVVAAMLDPDPRVDGTGVETLRRAGIDVEVGLLRDRALALNRPYVTYVDENRPWVTAKWAMSLDGKIATRTGDSAWITGEPARHRVHEMRDRCDAIMVGTGTLLADDPRLTSRIEGGDNPLRVVLDARLQSDVGANVFDTRVADTLAVVSPELGAEARARLDERGVECLPVATDERGRFDLSALLGELADRDVLRLFVEGGGTLIGALVDQGLVDHVDAFISSKLIGGRAAPSPVEGRGVEEVAGAPRLSETEVERVGDDVLLSGAVDSGN